MSPIIPPKVSEVELDNRFTYHAPIPGQLPRYAGIRQAFRQVAGLINDTCPACRETATALTHLETAMFHANAAIARHPHALPADAPEPVPPVESEPELLPAD